MKLYWNDPEPIKGNDYEVSSLIRIGDDMCLIEYNDGQSEAEVLTEELELR